MSHAFRPSRRQVLCSSACLLMPGILRGADTAPATQPVLDPAAGPASEPSDPIIDIHQHTNYSNRTDAQLIHNQRAMGVTQTILLPAGSEVIRPSTHDGKSNGLAATCGGNETAVAIAAAHPGEYFYFTNEVPDLPEAADVLRKYLKKGAMGIGEQKFNLDCDSSAIETVAGVAGEFNVPVLLHFQEGMYNKGFANFHKMLEKFPKVNFIAHAQSTWAYVDKNYQVSQGNYPTGKVTPGGITDRYLSDYENMWVDISAGSGLNFLIRDEEHARGFLDRHENKIMFGSDCTDAVGRGPTCQGWMTIHTIRRLASRAIERKILYENARKLFKL